ncbi:hypothetical protein AOLI_G00294540 [Acnodon oligacanthus]
MTARLEELPPPRGGRAAREGLLKAADGTAACPARCLRPKPPHLQIRRGARATSSRTDERAFVSLARSVSAARAGQVRERASAPQSARPFSSGLVSRRGKAAAIGRACLQTRGRASSVSLWLKCPTRPHTSAGRGSAESRGAAELLQEHEDGRRKDQRVTGGGALTTLWNGRGFLSCHAVPPLSPSVEPTQVTLQEKLFCCLFTGHSARLTAEESRGASPDHRIPIQTL